MKRPRIVIVGGGFGGVEAFTRLHRFAHHKNGADVVVIDQNNYFLFTPMLHEVATGSISRTHLTVPLRNKIRCCAHQFVRATVKKIDRESRVVITDSGEYPYDYCVVAVGSRSTDFGVPGVAEYGFPLKTLKDCDAIRNRIIHCFEQASQEEDKEKRKALVHFAVVGGGPTGVEFAGQLGELFSREMRILYPNIPPSDPTISIVESGEKVLSKFSDYFGTHAMRELKKMGVQTVTSNRVVKVEKNGVHLHDGNHLNAHTVVWTSGVQSNADKVCPKKDLDDRGRVIVGEHLHRKNDKRVFVIGDAMRVDEPSVGFVPQTAQAAVQAAALVADNIHRSILGKSLKPFRYRAKGDLIPIGDWFAVAQLGPIHFKGRIAWWIRRTVFLITMYSWSDRIRIALDWTLNMVTLRDTSEL